MFSEKLLVGVLTLGWRLVRAVALLALGGSRRPALTQTAIPEGYIMPRQRGRFGDSLTWITVLALLVIGIPLANADPEFKANATHGFQALLQVKDHLSSLISGIVS